MSLLIFHNPRCGKSREALQYLQQKNVEFQIVLYLHDTPSFEEMKQIISKLKIKPLDLIRKKENIFKENFSGQDLSDDEWIHILIQHPILIERPLIISDRSAVIGRPKENIEKLFKA
ncbi:MAG: arsenate reductase (glutaredoxin) [Deltaproteobacteria bacterium]